MAHSPDYIAIPRTIDASIAPATGALMHLSGETMGTSWSVRLYPSATASAAIASAIQRVLDTIVDQMSLWQPDSTICRVHRDPIGTSRWLPDAFTEVMSASLELAARTDGAFDPAIGACTDLWGFGPAGRPAEQPTLASVTNRLSTSGWRHIAWDPARQILCRHEDVKLDLNGIAKGYAVDAIMSALNSLGVAHALVEIGGELKGCGFKADGTPWWVDIDHSSSISPLRIALHGLAVATSGCERHHRFGELTVAHTIDPETGQSVHNTMLAVSVLHESCMWADGYATALMVMGVDRALTFATRNHLAVLISERLDDGGIRLRFSPALRAMLS